MLLLTCEDELVLLADQKMVDAKLGEWKGQEEKSDEMQTFRTTG